MNPFTGAGCIGEELAAKVVVEAGRKGALCQPTSSRRSDGKDYWIREREDHATKPGREKG